MILPLKKSDTWSPTQFTVNFDISWFGKGKQPFACRKYVWMSMGCVCVARGNYLWHESKCVAQLTSTLLRVSRSGVEQWCPHSQHLAWVCSEPPVVLLIRRVFLGFSIQSTQTGIACCVMVLEMVNYTVTKIGMIPICTCYTLISGMTR